MWDCTGEPDRPSYRQSARVDAPPYASYCGAIQHPNQANNNFTVEFFGRAAHAAGDPWKGRSALDAVELMIHGANLMREEEQVFARQIQKELGLPGHSWAASASHGLPGAGKVATHAAKVLALTGVDLLTQPKLLEQARADFAKRTEGKPYRSPIPAGQKPPLP